MLTLIQVLKEIDLLREPVGWLDLSTSQSVVCSCVTMRIECVCLKLSTTVNSVHQVCWASLPTMWEWRKCSRRPPLLISWCWLARCSPTTANCAGAIAAPVAITSNPSPPRCLPRPHPGRAMTSQPECIRTIRFASNRCKPWRCHGQNYKRTRPLSIASLVTCDSNVGSIISCFMR